SALPADRRSRNGSSISRMADSSVADFIAIERATRRKSSDTSHDAAHLAVRTSREPARCSAAERIGDDVGCRTSGMKQDFPPVRDRATTADRRRVSLAEKVEFLRRPDTYPEAPASVQAIETHMAWVFLTDTLVYKMRKPVRLPFLDMSSLERRRRCTEDSLRLNRRLAPTVYLDVVPLVLADDGRLRLGGPGRVVEWLEKM